MSHKAGDTRERDRELTSCSGLNPALDPSSPAFPPCAAPPDTLESRLGPSAPTTPLVRQQGRLEALDSLPRPYRPSPLLPSPSHLPTHSSPACPNRISNVKATHTRTNHPAWINPFEASPTVPHRHPIVTMSFATSSSPASAAALLVLV